MLELLLCSLVTILPDYLYRRYRQGKRFGKEITLYSVWYELRYGITSCVILTVLLITTIFYNHPSTTSATLFFRTVPILPETNGRVAEIYVGHSGPIAKGAPIFRLDSTKQQAALETARRKVIEVEAAMIVAQADILKAEGQLREATSNEQQVQDELDTKRELHRRNPGIVPIRDIERLEVRLPVPRARSPPPRRPSSRPKSAFRACFRPRRPAQRPSWPRRRWSSTRPSSAPGWTDGWSSSSFGSATSSIR